MKRGTALIRWWWGHAQPHSQRRIGDAAIRNCEHRANVYSNDVDSIRSHIASWLTKTLHNATIVLNNMQTHRSAAMAKATHSLIHILGTGTHIHPCSRQPQRRWDRTFALLIFHCNGKETVFRGGHFCHGRYMRVRAHDGAYIAPICRFVLRCYYREHMTKWKQNATAF